jgi:hypothetical protein
MRLDGVTLSLAAGQTTRKLLIRTPPPTGPGMHVVAAVSPANAGRVRSRTAAKVQAEATRAHAAKHPIRAIQRPPAMTRR